MPRTPFNLQVATQELLVFNDEIGSLIAPGVLGQLGVLARHAPLVVELGVGQLKIRFPDDSPQVIATTGGLLEVSKAGAIVLADHAELSEEIDVARAEAARERALRRLRGENGAEQVDIDRARAALARATNRLRAAGALH